MTLLRVLTYRACAGIRFFGCLCVLLAAFGCAHIDLSEGTGEEEFGASIDTGSTGDPDEGGQGDDNNLLDPNLAMTVTEALAADRIGCEVIVCGYYVGYAEGTSLSEDNLYLNTIPRKANTNLLLADDVFDDDNELVLPVELRTTGGVRDALNASNHSELLRKRLLIRGTLERYFGVNGLKKVSAWRVLGEDEKVGDGGAAEETPGTSDEPDSSDDNDNTGTTGGGTGEEVERVVFPMIVESRSAKIAK